MLGRKSNKQENKKTDNQVEEKKPNVSIEKLAKKSDKKKKFLTARFYNIIQKIHFTEKASNVLENNKYIFRVEKDANKIEIKKAVEGIYNVNVKGVNIINAKAKVRRYAATIGKKKSFKKAIVTLEEGESIDFTKK